MAEYKSAKRLDAFENDEADVCGDYTDGFCEWGFGRENIREMLNVIPAADVAPVVHCKDCARRGTPECGMYYECECGQQHTWETDNDYCSFGKRKEKRNE